MAAANCSSRVCEGERLFECKAVMAKTLPARTRVYFCESHAAVVLFLMSSARSLQISHELNLRIVVTL